MRKFNFPSNKLIIGAGLVINHFIGNDGNLSFAFLHVLFLVHFSLLRKATFEQSPTPKYPPPFVRPASYHSSFRGLSDVSSTSSSFYDLLSPSWSKVRPIQPR